MSLIADRGYTEIVLKLLSKFLLPLFEEWGLKMK